jgi:hypothetical protein
MSEANPFVIRDKEHMVEAVNNLALYMATYNDQVGYESYSAKIFVDDVLYGLGISLDKEKYQYGQGYREFKKDLMAFLKEDML